MTSPETPEARQAMPVEKIRTALLGYRVMAWTTGIWLIALCYEIVVALHRQGGESTDLDRRGTRLGLFHLCTGGFQPSDQGPLADRQDDRRAVSRNHPAGWDHRRALPDPKRQGAIQLMSLPAPAAPATITRARDRDATPRLFRPDSAVLRCN